MYTDASALLLGAVLMQKDARSIRSSFPYANCTLNQPKSNYSVTHQKTMEDVWALKDFRDIILGYHITVLTQQAAFTELFKVTNLTGRLYSYVSNHKGI